MRIGGYCEMKKILLQMLLAIFVVVGGTTAAHAEGEVQFPGISQFDYDTSYGYFSKRPTI